MKTVEIIDSSKIVEKEFYLDEKEKSFKGFTLGVSWNGWATPYFDKETCFKILDELTKNGRKEKANTWYLDDTKYSYSSRYDAFFETYNYDDSEAERDSIGEAVIIDGKKFYGLGNCIWTWQIA